MVAFTKLHSLCGQGFHGLNQALLILLPKTSDASTLRDYHPINIIHIFAKVVAKALASRLSPRLGGLVEKNQCTVIKKHCIHDNFTCSRWVSRVPCSSWISLMHSTRCRGLYLRYFSG